MESIKEVLKRKPTPNSLPLDSTTEVDLTKELERQSSEQLRCRRNVSSLENTFENFKVLPGTRDAYQAFKKFAAGTLSAPMLLCPGINGNGKTHLLEATAIEKGIRMVKWVDFIDSLKSRMGKAELFPTYEDIITGHKEASCLLIDDIGLGTLGRAWETTILEDLIDYRYHHWLPTAMTTNMDLKDFTDRVYDRFTDSERCMVVVNKGESQRKNAKELHK